jgi:putative hemolysin
MSVAQQIAFGAVALAGLAGSWMCSGLETGVYSVNRVTLEVRAGRKQHAATILRRELEQSERLLGTLLISNNIFNYLTALGATGLLALWGYSEWAIVGINAAILTPVLFIFAESIPKELFRQEADRLTYAFADILLLLRVVLTGLLVLPLVRRLGRVAARLLGAGPEVTLGTGRDRVAALIKESAGTGLLSDSQARLVDRALVFSSATVASEMIAWSKAVPVQIEWDRQRILRHMALNRHSSYPVIDRRGNVVGVLKQLDLLAHPQRSVEELVEPAVEVSSTMPLRDALMRLGEAGSELGLVVQGSRPLGVVGMRDLLEPLIGSSR